MTVVGITKEGWCYAPWKKPKGSTKTVRSPDAKPLFELADVAERNGHRAIRALRVFAFEREGKSDKGARQDELVADIAVGMTLRFKIHDFMYEVKTGRDNVFPSGIEFIPEFSLVEIMVLPGDFPPRAPSPVLPVLACLPGRAVLTCLSPPAGTTDSAQKGFGLSLSTIRPLEHTLHSYLHPLGLGLLPPTYDAAVGLATGLAGRGAPIQAIIETSCVSFFAAVSPRAFLSPVGDTMYRLSCADGPVVESLHEVDVRTEDLLRYTNAGEDLGYALFLVDLAASAGALSVFVVRDPYFQASARPSVSSGMPGLTRCPQKADPAFGEYRAIPLVDSERLLAFVDTSVSTGEDDEVQYDLPFRIDTLEQPYAVVSTVPAPFAGVAEAQCPDFVLQSETVRCGKGYAISVGDAIQVLPVHLADTRRASR